METLLNWTTIITGAVSSAFNGVALYLATRYVAKIADRVEKKEKSKGGKK